MCESSGCSLIARVHVALLHGDWLHVCVPHWGEVLRTQRKAIRSMRLVPLPRCFVTRCQCAAVTIVGSDPGEPLPVCQRHLDNLTWAAPCEATDARAAAGHRG